MEFNIYDLTEYLGTRTKAQCKVAYLRLNGLGRLKQVTIESNNRYGKVSTQYRLIAHFNPDEVLEYIDKVILEHKLNPFYKPKKQHSDAWKSYIELANYFKDKEK